MVMPRRRNNETSICQTEEVGYESDHRLANVTLHATSIKLKLEGGLFASRIQDMHSQIMHLFVLVKIA